MGMDNGGGQQVGVGNGEKGRITVTEQQLINNILSKGRNKMTKRKEEEEASFVIGW